MRERERSTLDYQFTYGALLYLYSIAKVISNINRQPPNARACSRSPSYHTSIVSRPQSMHNMLPMPLIACL